MIRTYSLLLRTARRQGFLVPGRQEAGQLQEHTFILHPVEEGQFYRFVSYYFFVSGCFVGGHLFAPRCSSRRPSSHRRQVSYNAQLARSWSLVLRCAGRARVVVGGRENPALLSEPPFLLHPAEQGTFAALQGCCRLPPPPLQLLPPVARSLLLR
jgi:hypothetical protein